jgi:putative transposase
MLGGTNKQTIFQEEVDKRAFLKRLIKYKDRCNYKVYGYCLMDNQVHLLMKESEREHIGHFTESQFELRILV